MLKKQALIGDLLVCLVQHNFTGNLSRVFATFAVSL